MTAAFRTALCYVLLTASGTFLTATPSGALTATAPSRGPLEGFTLELTQGSLFPSVAVKTSSGSFISVPEASRDEIMSKKATIRADAEEVGEREGIRVKCQREFVLKARVAAVEGKEGGAGKRRLLDRGPAMGSVEDELRKK